jgi:hypothetical protein
MRSRALRIDALMASLGGLALAAVIAGSCMARGDAGDQLTRNAIRLALVWYAAALLLMIRLDRSDWEAAAPRGRMARWCWTWGLACYLVHLAMAFHYFHHWSHAEAFESTRRQSGNGEGIYASYLFTALWLADVVCWWLLPRRYAARSVWLDRMLHAYMLFIVFNGTVVFAVGPVRWAGLAMFAVLAGAWLAARGAPRVRPV